MTTGEIVITAYITLLSAGLGTLFWRQLEAVRGEMVQFRGEVAAEFVRLREQMADRRRELHAEVASLRSDLTQVALAVGARRPWASEG